MSTERKKINQKILGNGFKYNNKLYFYQLFDAKSELEETYELPLQTFDFIRVFR